MVCKLVVDDTVDGKDNLDKKTREVADIRMYHFGWNFLQLLWGWWFLLSTCLTTLSTCELVVYDTVDVENNQLEKTMEVAGIRIYHYGWNFFSSKRM